MSETVLKVEVRERTGTSGARETRREGLVPGVIYGGARGAIPISLERKAIMTGLSRGGFLAHVVEIEHKGERQSVLVRDIQFHPVTSSPLHVDLYRVDDDQVINVDVHVEFINSDASPGLKRGGALNIVRHTVELLVPAGDIPEKIVVDLTGLDINDGVHISHVTLPANAKPVIQDRDFTIATIVGKGITSDAGEGDGAEGDA